MRRLTLAILMFSLTVAATAQSAPAAPSKAAAPSPTTWQLSIALTCRAFGTAGPRPTSTSRAHFYAQGPNHLFFDVAPLKYNSWEEYKAGVAPSLKDTPKVTYK